MTRFTMRNEPEEIVAKSANRLMHIPLSLYVHIPWCIKKCPYCDFNSHALDPTDVSKEELFSRYADKVCEDIRLEAGRVAQKKLSSVFFGGGTPSLLPTKFLAKIMDCVHSTFECDAGMEVTLETNPGTSEYTSFSDLVNAGINRISFGAQSFDNSQLAKLGRIHSASETLSAFDKARSAGIDNINIDIMYALPQQSEQDAIKDLEQACALQPEHISWYQLTIEPNTAFYSKPPELPQIDLTHLIDSTGRAFLADQGFSQYEISAYSKSNKQSIHNNNYWLFGDYLGVGAGAHGKLTKHNNFQILRRQKTRLPADYLKTDLANVQTQQVENDDVIFEFMLNAMRLTKSVSYETFEQRTNISRKKIAPEINRLIEKGLLANNPKAIEKTEMGHAHANTIMSEFLS